MTRRKKIIQGAFLQSKTEYPKDRPGHKISRPAKGKKSLQRDGTKKTGYRKVRERDA